MTSVPSGLAEHADIDRNPPPARRGLARRLVAGASGLGLLAAAGLLGSGVLGERDERAAGVVLRAEADEGRPSDRLPASYSLEVRFEARGASFRFSQRGIPKSHSAGDPVEVRYPRGDPSRARLAEPDWTWLAWILGLTGAALTAAALAGLRLTRRAPAEADERDLT